MFYPNICHTFIFSISCYCFFSYRHCLNCIMEGNDSRSNKFIFILCDMHFSFRDGPFTNSFNIISVYVLPGVLWEGLLSSGRLDTELPASLRHWRLCSMRHQESSSTSCCETEPLEGRSGTEGLHHPSGYPRNKQKTPTWQLFCLQEDS